MYSNIPQVEIKVNIQEFRRNKKVNLQIELTEASNLLSNY